MISTPVTVHLSFDRFIRVADAAESFSLIDTGSAKSTEKIVEETCML